MADFSESNKFFNVTIAIVGNVPQSVNGTVLKKSTFLTDLKLRMDSTFDGNDEIFIDLDAGCIRF